MEKQATGERVMEGEAWGDAARVDEQAAERVLEVETRLTESSGQSEREVVDNMGHGSQQKIIEEQQYKSEHELQPILEAGLTRAARLELEVERDRTRIEKPAAEERVREMQAERDRARMEGQAAEERVREMQAERERARVEVEATQDRVRLTENTVRLVEHRLRETEGERDRAKAEKIAAEETIRQINEKLRKLGGRMEEMEVERRRMVAGKQTAEERLKEVLRERDRARFMVQEAEEKLRDMEGERDRARVEKQTAKDRLLREGDRVKLELRQAQVKMHELQIRLAKLEQSKHERLLQGQVIKAELQSSSVQLAEQAGDSAVEKPVAELSVYVTEGKRDDLNLTKHGEHIHISYNYAYNFCLENCCYRTLNIYFTHVDDN